MHSFFAENWLFGGFTTILKNYDLTKKQDETSGLEIMQRLTNIDLSFFIYPK